MSRNSIPVTKKKHRPKLKTYKHDYVKAAVLSARDSETRCVYKEYNK